MPFSIQQYLANRQIASDEINEFHKAQLEGEILFLVPTPIEFRIKYESEEEHKSDRRLSILAKGFTAKENFDIRFSAKCIEDFEDKKEDNKTKTYLASRILELINLATGEIIEDPIEYLRSHPYLNEGFNLIDCPIDRALYENREEIYLLSAMAKIDNDYNIYEYDVILCFLDECCGFQVTEAQLKNRISRFSFDLYLVEQNIINLISKDKSHNAFKKALKNVINADEIVHENEIGFAKYILKHLPD